MDNTNMTIEIRKKTNLTEQFELISNCKVKKKTCRKGLKVLDLVYYFIFSKISATLDLKRILEQQRSR